MSDYLTLTIPGDPISQQRPRLFRRGKKTICFDPQATEKRHVRQHIADYMEDKEWVFPQYPRVCMFFYMPIPKSLSKDFRHHALQERLKHVKKPDVDNVCKFYLDVMTGLVIEDDNCVSLGKVLKIYSPNPRTMIFIEEQSPYVTEKDLYG